MDVHPHRPSEPPTPASIHPRAVPDIATLTRQLVAGDEAAYRMFYDAYFGRLSRYLLVVTAGDEHAAREALQGTFTRVVRHIRVFTDEPAFWSWLTVLARSARFDERRKHRRYLAFLDRFKRHVAPEAVDVVVADETETLDESLARHLAQLPADERELLGWKYLERRSVRDIAAQLGTTEKTVESRLTRLRRRLKEAMLADLKHERSE